MFALYDGGTFIERDTEVALQWLHRAVAQNDSNGACAECVAANRHTLTPRQLSCI